MGILKKIFITCLFFVIFIIFPTIFGFFLFFFYDSSFKFLRKNKCNFFSVYDINKEILYNFNHSVEYGKLPKNLINAFIAIEDTQFFSHYGFSVKSIIRSFWKNIKERQFVQGGSTITQQYIKLYNGDLSKTITRKIKDFLLSILIEFYYTKEEIFELYCNILYFGKNIYGVANCSRILFNKNYEDLSLSECALIAGIVQRPEYFNPIKHYNTGIKKRNLVLKSMLRENFISKKEYESTIKENNIIYQDNYFDFGKSIIQSIEKKIINLNLSLQNEYTIFTTIEKNIQKISVALFNKSMNALKKISPAIEGALIITEYKTGKIIAFINGYNLFKNTNKVFEWERQLGSIIKPYVIYFALINGDTVSTEYTDSPLEDKFKWNPNNCNKKFKGLMTIENALISSNNIVPIRILDKYGSKKFSYLLKNFFTTVPPYLSLALGCIQATPLIAITLFNTLLNEGEKKIPYFIEKIIKKSGGICYENYEDENTDLSNNNHILESSATKEVKKILQKIGNSLAKKYNFQFNNPIYAKTGTTNDAISCWFTCADEKYSIAIVIGTDSNEKLSQHGISSIKKVAPLGLHILHEIQKNA